MRGSDGIRQIMPSERLGCDKQINLWRVTLTETTEICTADVP